MASGVSMLLSKKVSKGENRGVNVNVYVGMSVRLSWCQ